MNPAILLPVLTGGAIYCLLTNWSKSRTDNLYKTIILLAIAVVIQTELLSLLRLYNFTGAVVFWSLLLVMIVGAAYIKKVNCLKAIPDFAYIIRPDSWMIWLIFVVVIITGFIAVVSPPTTWDSMTYHLARIPHWIQNNSIAHYPTNIVRQLFQPPAAEFMIAQTMILSQTDKAVNLIQWVAFILSIIGTSLVARELGFGKNAFLLTALITATIPMAVLQASSTQNDLVLAFWTVTITLFAIKLYKNFTYSNQFWLSAAVAMAALSKGTAYIYIGAIVLILGILLLMKYRLKVWTVVVIGAAVFLLINGPHFYRNYQLFHHPLGPENSRYTNDELSLETVAANVIRNTANHAFMPTKAARINTRDHVKKLFNYLHLKWNNPKTSWEGMTFGEWGPELIFHEDISANTLHFIMLSISMVLIFLLVIIRKPVPAGLAIIATGTVIFFLVFSMYLKWQPWHSRQQLGWFMLGAPLIAYALSRINNRIIIGIIAGMVFLCALPWLVYNVTRPLLKHPMFFDFKQRPTLLDTTRETLYFNARVGCEQDYLKVINMARQQKWSRIGLIAGENDWEYPLWILTNHKTFHQTQIEHIMVDNESMQIRRKQEFIPEVIFRTRKPLENQPMVEFESISYRQVYHSKFINVYTKSE